MSDGEALAIVPSWSRAIRYRPSLVNLLSLTFLFGERLKFRLLSKPLQFTHYSELIP
jgi:hypothetical protein